MGFLRLNLFKIELFTLIILTSKKVCEFGGKGEAYGSHLSLSVGLIQLNV